MDLVTPAYRGASALARLLPAPVVDVGAPGLAALMARRPSDRRAMVERHQRRVDGSLSGAELDARMSYEGYEHIQKARADGFGPLVVMPHLGSWEWSAYWLTRVEQVPVTAVVERIEPPALFDWFVEYRESIGMEIVPLGPDAGRSVVNAVKARHAIALLCDRDISRSGVEVTFFGETTTLPSGPAVLALRTGAPLLPTAVYDRGRTHHGVVRPPIPVDRQGTFRADVARITQALARELEVLISAAPEQWHLMQPNWPSDWAERASVRL